MLLGLLSAACGGGGTGGASQAPPAPPSSCPIPTAKANPTWSGDIYPFIQASCGTAAVSCHGGPSAAGRKDYSLSANAVHASLVGQPFTGIPGWEYIKAGDPTRSWLYEKVAPVVAGEPGTVATGSKIGSQMPLGGSLCQPTTDTLRTWIQLGAPNN
jgi:hypothetical protein